MVQYAMGKLQSRNLVSIWNLPELRQIEILRDEIQIGAGSTYTDLRKHQMVGAEFPLLARAACWTGGIANQNRGTLGGNIVNASPAADSLPALPVYEAELILTSDRGERRLRKGLRSQYGQPGGDRIRKDVVPGPAGVTAHPGHHPADVFLALVLDHGLDRLRRRHPAAVRFRRAFRDGDAPGGAGSHFGKRRGLRVGGAARVVESGRRPSAVAAGPGRGTPAR